MNFLFYIFGYLFKWDLVCEFLVIECRVLEYLIGDNKIFCRKDICFYGVRREFFLLSFLFFCFVDILIIS